MDPKKFFPHGQNDAPWSLPRAKNFCQAARGKNSGYGGNPPLREGDKCFRKRKK